MARGAPCHGTVDTMVKPPLCVFTVSAVCRAGSMKLSSVRPSVLAPAAAAAGLLLWARPPGDIERLLHGQRPAANASSVTLPGDVRS